MSKEILEKFAKKYQTNWKNPAKENLKVYSYCLDDLTKLAEAYHAHKLADLDPVAYYFKDDKTSQVLWPNGNLPANSIALYALPESTKDVA